VAERSWEVRVGDCVEVMRSMPESSVDAIVCDPPYGSAPIEELSVIRLDGDWYESTMDGLVNLYPKLSVGGYLIVDDYGCVPACRQAVHDYRDSHGITEEIRSIDWTGIFWQRTE
jgi:DNA modification methylase